MRIVVLDGFTLNPGDLSWEELASLGQLTVYDRSAREQILERSRDAEILVTNKAPLDDATIKALPALRFIAVTATGVNVVDVEAARTRGVIVSNVPAYGTHSVAQFTIALLLELASRVGQHHRAVEEGAWARAQDFCFWLAPLLELAGLEFGIVGFGAIGRRVGSLASALGMSVLAAGRPGGNREPPGYDPFAWCDQEELFARADVVSLHCPLTPATEGLVDRRRLAAMKRSAFLINTARGALVDERALADALERGEIAGAAVDVVSTEPISADNPLLSAPHCVVTPHIAWASLQARERLMAATAANVRAFLAGTPLHLVG